jgi:hypothetical protein
MYVGNQVSKHFIEGLKTFLETIVEYKKTENMSDVHYRCCRCIDCCNEKKTRDIEEIHEHLLVREFMIGYTCWRLCLDQLGQSTVNIRRLCLRTLMWEVMMM